MQKGYYTQCITFERRGNDDGTLTLMPVRIRRAWKDDGTFGIVECESLSWYNRRNAASDVPDWDSNRIKPETRDELIAAGVIHLPGDGWPQGCFMINP